jgi:hypothetical protein
LLWKSYSPKASNLGKKDCEKVRRDAISDVEIRWGKMAAFQDSAFVAPEPVVFKTGVFKTGFRMGNGWDCSVGRRYSL